LSNKLKFVLPYLDTDDKLGIVDDRTGAAANDRQIRQPVLKFGRIPPDLRSGTSSLRSSTLCKRSAAYNERSRSFQTCHHTVSVERYVMSILAPITILWCDGHMIATCQYHCIKPC